MESPLSVIDAVIVIFTVLSAILAMARGITREVLGIASFFGAGLIAAYCAEFFAPVLTSFMDLKPLADKFSGSVETISSWISGIIIFVISWILLTLVTAKISRYINNSAVSGVDSAMGFVYGAIRGLFVLGIVYNMYIHFIPPEKHHISVSKAHLKPVLDEASNIIIKLAGLFLPERVADGFSKREQGNYNESSTPKNSDAIISDTIKSNMSR